MKTETVRIRTEQANKLRDVAYQMRGCTTNALVTKVSINAMVQDAIDLWYEVEGTVILAAFKEARGKLNKRQAVANAS